MPVYLTHAELRKKFEVIESQLAELRQAILDGEADDDPHGMKRLLTFLGVDSTRKGTHFRR